MQAPLNMGNGNWDKDLGNRIRWQVGGGQQTAEIKLSPPHLGALEIRVSVSNDQTHVQLVSHHAVVRDVMEANLPRLREMLAEQGMNQVNVNVSDQSLAQQRERGQAQTFDVVGGSQADDMDLSDSEAEPLTSRGSAGMGQVDYFA
ncbi:MAG: flagellar hook-length control protein FliK [Chromatiales bacterium]|nr:flagellar hook-length control protein FliK [Chromatiales bacterium]